VIGPVIVDLDVHLNGNATVAVIASTFIDHGSVNDHVNG